MPFAVVCFLPDYYFELSFLITFYLYYMSYALNFYIILATNSLFRNEFLIMFRFRVEVPPPVNKRQVNDNIELPIM